MAQKQALLAYLGYYNGPLDGIWGEKSQRATIDFQRAYMASADGNFNCATEARILDKIAQMQAEGQDMQSALEILEVKPDAEVE